MIQIVANNLSLFYPCRAVWLVPLLFLLVIAGVIVVLLIVGFVCLRTSKTKATKGV